MHEPGAAEPLLRRLIPDLIVIFLLIVGLARFVELYQLRAERDYDARETMGLIASVLTGALRDAAEAENPSPVAFLNTLADALPPGATGDGRRVYVANAAGTVVATPSTRSSPSARIIRVRAESRSLPQTTSLPTRLS